MPASSGTGLCLISLKNGFDITLEEISVCTGELSGHITARQVGRGGQGKNYGVLQPVKTISCEEGHRMT